MSKYGKWINVADKLPKIIPVGRKGERRSASVVVIAAHGSFEPYVTQRMDMYENDGEPPNADDSNWTEGGSDIKWWMPIPKRPSKRRRKRRL